VERRNKIIEDIERIRSEIEEFKKSVDEIVETVRRREGIDKIKGLLSERKTLILREPLLKKLRRRFARG